MTTKNRLENLSEEEIDEIVIAQGEDDTAWEAPISVSKPRTIIVSLPSEIAARAAFFAHLHGTSSTEAWLRNVIQQRINFEEAAFAEVKQSLRMSSGQSQLGKNA